MLHSARRSAKMPSGSQLYRSSGTKLQGKRQKYACNRGSVSRFVALASAPGYLPDETGRNPLASTAELPLLGKRIIVTAPRQYAQKLCSKLVNVGACPLWVPGVSIGPVEDGSAASQEFDQALQQLIWDAQQAASGSSTAKAATYTHVAFTSKNGIYAVLTRLMQLLGSQASAVEVLQRCGARLCALGADGEVLQKAGLTLHVSPKEASTQGLVKELVSRGEAQGARVLCPVPLVLEPLKEPPVVPRFIDALVAAGAQPTRVPAYVTGLGCREEDARAERGLLEDGAVHAIAFSSTAEAQGLIQAMGGLPALSKAITTHSVLLAAHGPYTAAGVSDTLGLPVTCVSKSFSTFDGIVSALEEFLSSR